MAIAGGDTLRERWRAWAQRSLGGTPPQIEAATDAAMRAIQAGAPQEEVVSQATAAWHRPGGARAAPSVPQAALPVPSTTQRVSGSPSPGLIAGHVAGFQQRQELRGRRYLMIWDFRVERPGAPPVAIEMRGYAFDGALANGDEVRVAATPGSRGIVHTSTVENLTSNSTIRVTRRPHPLVGGFGSVFKWTFRLAFFILWAAVAVTIVIFILRHGSP